MKTAFVIGRLIFGGFFLYNGLRHLQKRKELAQYAEAKHIPKAEAAVILSGLAILLGGASIVAGAKPKLGAAAILGFLAAVSPTMHNFWKAETPEQHMNDMVNFTKNVALLGAALAFMGVKEPWPVSLALAPSGAAHPTLNPRGLD